MNPLCCIAPVSIDRDRANPVVTKSGPQCQLSIEPSVRTVNYTKPSFSSQVSSVNADTDRSSPSVMNHTSMAIFDEPIIGEVNAVHGVAGILYKWVNYGKGWRSRWFVLEDGVLSYYKIHGPDKILMSPSREKSVRVIGEDSVRYMRKANWTSNRVNSVTTLCKPFGEIHLKVILLSSFLLSLNSDFISAFCVIFIAVAKRPVLSVFYLKEKEYTYHKLSLFVIFNSSYVVIDACLEI